MRVLNNYNQLTRHASEYEMQEQVDKFLKEQKYARFQDWYPYQIDLPTIVVKEFRVPEVNRISDHILLINERRAINVECKLEDIGGAIAQASDHLRWCDYSVICMIPDGTYIPAREIQNLINKGIGLWYWFKDVGIFEFIYPKFNRNKDMDKRKKIIKRIIDSQPEPELNLQGGEIA